MSFLNEDDLPPPDPVEPRFEALGTVRSGLGGCWPIDKPFPWTDAECAAFVRGHQVKWPLTLEEFFLLPGKIEMTDGYAVLWRS